MEHNNIIHSKKFKVIMGIIGGLIILLFVFGVGVFVGMRRADFSFRWAQNYQRNFGGPRGGFFIGHGIAGQIIQINNASSTPSLVISSRDNVEKVILITPETIINGPQNNLKPGDLKVSDRVVVIGDPTSAGQIEARLIRITP